MERLSYRQILVGEQMVGLLGFKKDWLRLARWR
jgi:hypothetical protein